MRARSSSAAPPWLRAECRRALDADVDVGGLLILVVAVGEGVSCCRRLKREAEAKTEAEIETEIW
jgi:hypothetical protein